MLKINYKLSKKKIYQEFFSYYLFKYQRIFFGSLIKRGLKIKAFNLFLKLKYNLKIKENIDPNIIFFFSLYKLTPIILLFPYKLGGKLEGIPLPISWKKKLTYSTKWVIKLLRDKYKKLKLSDIVDILISAIYDKGLSFKYKISKYNESVSNRFLIKYFKY